MSKSLEPLVKTNAKTNPFRDMYYALILMPWLRFVGLLGLCFWVVNLGFGAIYLYLGGLANVGQGYWAHVFFSVHTMATVGYGNVYPQSMVANAMVSFEIMLGLFMIALMTGLIFAKFSRPQSRVIFSEFAVIHKRNGVDCLVFRTANERSHHVAEATLNVVLLKSEVTSEGDKVRRQYSLTLERAQTPLFVLSWIVFHAITPESPLYGLTQQDFIDGDMRLIISLTGYDAILGQTVHARHIYHPEMIKFGYRLKDALTTVGKNQLHLDFNLFHEIEPV